MTQVPLQKLKRSNRNSENNSLLSNGETVTDPNTGSESQTTFKKRNFYGSATDKSLGFQPGRVTIFHSIYKYYLSSKRMKQDCTHLNFNVPSSSTNACMFSVPYYTPPPINKQTEDPWSMLCIHNLALPSIWMCDIGNSYEKKRNIYAQTPDTATKINDGIV